MTYKTKQNIQDRPIANHRSGKILTNNDFGTMAFYIPKSYILKNKKANADSFVEPQFKYNCIYFLIGYEVRNDISIEKIYVGQAGIRDNQQSVLDRLNEHTWLGNDPEKYMDKWSDIVVVTNEKGAWGATELDAIEHIFWSLIPVGNRLNSQKPSCTGAKLEDFNDAVNQIKEYLNYLDFTTFKEKTEESIVNDIKMIAEAKSDIPVDLDHGTTRIPNYTTPNRIVNQMLDMLPEEVWNDNTVFLDPACKDGGFLRKIFDRLYEKLINKPEIMKKYKTETRLRNHILSRQIYGIAMNQNSRAVTLDTLELEDFGENIVVIPNYIQILREIRDMCNKINKNGKNGKDTKKEEKEKAEYIQSTLNKEFGTDMKVDVVIGNPPYQEMTYSGLNESGGIALFDRFMDIGVNIANRVVCLITPTKWIAGEQSNFEYIRRKMTDGHHIVTMVDYMNSKDVFDQDSVSIAGGVSYFLYDKKYNGKTKFTTVLGEKYTHERNLHTDGIIPRHAIGEYVIEKIKKTDRDFIMEHVYKNRYGLGTDFYTLNDENVKQEDCIKIVTPQGNCYVRSDRFSMVNTKDFKVMFTRVVTGRAAEADKNNQYTILSSLGILEPGEICNASYMVVGDINKREYAENIMKYLKTKFVRFLILQTLFGIGLTVSRFQFVPMQDFREIWTDEKLYKKYELTTEEINFIEKIIKPME